MATPCKGCVHSCRQRQVLAALAVLLPQAFAGTGQRGSYRTAAELVPVHVETVAALQGSGPELRGDVALPMSAHAGRPVPEGLFTTEERFRELKQRARVSGRVPMGRNLHAPETQDGRLGATAGAASTATSAGVSTVFPEDSAPTLLQGFEGLNVNISGGFPPDTIIAAGPERVLEGTNFVLRLSKRHDKDVRLQTINAHFGVAESRFLFDPKVYYDRLSGRFFVVVLEVDFAKRRAFIYLSISRGSNPVSLASGWCNYRLQGRRGGSWGDFPGLGVNERWIGISVNSFRFSSNLFRRAVVRVIEKQPLVDNAASCPKAKVFTFNATRDPEGEIAFTVQPAQHYSKNAVAGTPLYFVSSRFGTNNAYVVWQVKQPTTLGASARPTLVRTVLTGTLYTMPPDAAQKGPIRNLETNDNRVLQVAFRDGALWGAMTTGCNMGKFPNESCVRAFRITPPGPNAAGKVEFEATYGGGPGEFFWMPGLAVNARGDVVVAFQRSGKSLHLGIGYNGKRAQARGFDNIRVLRRGKCGLNDVDSIGRNRTGDYVGAQTDPKDDRGFWIAGEYSRQISGCDWATRIARVRY